MSAYCTYQQVQSEFPSLDVSGTPAITSTEIDRFIEEESQVIDDHVGKRYTLPIIGVGALIRLRKICIDLVSYRIAKILRITPLDVSSDGAVYQKNGYLVAYEAAMKQLKAYENGVDFLSDGAVSNLGGLDYVLAESPDLLETW